MDVNKNHAKLNRKRILYYTILQLCSSLSLFIVKNSKFLHLLPGFIACHRALQRPCLFGLQLWLKQLWASCGGKAAVLWKQLWWRLVVWQDSCWPAVCYVNIYNALGCWDRSCLIFLSWSMIVVLISLIIMVNMHEVYLKIVLWHDTWSNKIKKAVHEDKGSPKENVSHKSCC
jgi:hypothetical protein